MPAKNTKIARLIDVRIALLFQEIVLNNSDSLAS